MPSEPSPDERWEHVSHLYHAALERPASQREEFLEKACHGDDTLRQQVASLLGYAEAGGFLDQPALAGSNTTPVGDSAVDDLTSRDIGGYRVICRIGAGGMGVVYKAVDAKFRRPVAIKLLSAGSADTAARRRFLREAKTASSLNHPHILTVHDVGDVDGRQYLVTEFVDGGTLRDWAHAEPRTWQQVVDLLTGVADALATAHEAGIIHRDIKPQNILVSRSGYAKLADFGLAKVAEAFNATKTADVESEATRRGTVMGTAGYMSPEQTAGALVDAKSDIFSFGIVLHEMLAGRRPFAASSTAEELHRILYSAPDPLGDTVPQPLQRVVQRALEKLPEHRYQSVRELLADLRRISRASAAELGAIVPVQSRFRRPLLIMAAAALAAIAGGLFALRAPARDAATAPRVRSIAVLPFQNLSGDPSQEYFSDGMTDILTTNLAQIHALNVTSRTSAMQFKSTKQTIPEIGRVLGVDAIVSSSIQRSGNRVRIAAQLIRASTDTHLWAKEFNGNASDLLELQSDVARSIAEEIRVQIAPEERERLSKFRKVAPEAHDALLLGRYQYGRGDLEGYKQAIESYERAIELQPDYAAAYAALSLTLWNLRNAGGSDHTDRIRSTAYRAVQLDPALAEAHAAVGIISMDDWEWERAEQAFRKGMDLNPDSQDTCLCYAALLSILGRHAESVALTQHSAAVNPLSSVTFANLGMRLLEARRYQEAETAFHRALGLEPQNFVARFFLAEVFSSTGRFEDALRTLDTAAFQGTAWLAKTYASAGRRRQAMELIRKIAPVAMSADFVPLAAAYGNLGDKDRAFEWLTKAFDARTTPVGWARVGTLFDVLRDDPRFDALVARLHLPGLSSSGSSSLQDLQLSTSPL